MNIILECRRKLGWSQEQLAKASGVGRTTIQRLEMGRGEPSPETCMALAEALGVPPEKIHSYTGTKRAFAGIMTACVARSPTKKELAPFRVRDRRTLTRFFDARDEVVAATEELRKISDEQAAAWPRHGAAFARNAEPETQRQALERWDSARKERERLHERFDAALSKCRRASEAINKAHGPMLILLIRLG